MTVWVAVRRFSVRPPTAVIVAAGLFASPPLVGYGTQVYPEIPAALAVTVAIGALTGGPGKGRIGPWWFASLAAVVVLPWLAVKYAPVAAVLAMALLAKLLGARFGTSAEQPDGGGSGQGALSGPAVTSTLPLILTAAVLAVAGGLYLLIHRRIYGGWTVYATGDHFVDGEFQVVGADPNYLGRSRRLIGLLIDRGFGLMAWAPAYGLLIPAIAAAARRRISSLWLLCSALGAGWAMATWVALTMHGWWWPGRQLVVVLPVAVLFLAMFLDGSSVARRIFCWLTALAIGNWLWLVFEASTGRRTLIVDFTETSSPLYRLWAPLLPDHRVWGPADIALTTVWAVALVAVASLAWRRADRLARPGHIQAAEAETEAVPV